MTESARETLTSHIEWADGPWLGFVFATDSSAVATLMASLGAPSRRLQPATPQELRSALPRILGGVRAPILWVDAIHDEAPTSPPGPWTEALDWLMMRANERRGPLLAANQGLLFVAHPSAKARIREAAPDLWSVRAVVLDLGATALPIRDATPGSGASVASDAEALLQQGWASEAADQASAWLAVVEPADHEQRAAALELRARARHRLGERHDALADIERALPLRRGLVPADPGDVEPRSRLARCLSLQGQIAWELGAAEPARAALEEALDLRRAITRDSDDAESLSDLAMAWSLLGDVHADAHRDDAEQAFREAARLRRRIAEETGAHRHLRLLSVALGRLGRHVRRDGRPRAARPLLEESAQLAMRLARTDPGRVAWRMEASVAHSRLAEVLHDLGALDRAEAALQQAVVVRRDLHEQEPHNRRWQALLAVVLGKLAEVQVARGRVEAATKAAVEALGHSRAAQTGSPHDRRGLTISWMRCGDVALAGGDRVEAERCWAEAAKLLPEVATVLPEAADGLREALEQRRHDTP